MYEYFVIYDKSKLLYCEYIAYYFIHPDYKILGKRISPYFIYTSEFGYIKSFDEINMTPILIEEKTLQDYQYNIEIIVKNGCHLFQTIYDQEFYYYTIPYKTRTKILSKSNKKYYLECGGWTTQYIQQKLPEKKNIKLFRFFKIQNPFFVIITNHYGTNIEKSNIHLDFGTIIPIFKKGFFNNQKILYTNSGYIYNKDCIIIGNEIKQTINFLQNDNCHICNENKINCSFIHKDFSHSFCCLECSMKLNSSSCPICREKVEKIVLIY
jgi:hypothetical protein